MNSEAEPTDPVEAILEQQLKAWRNTRRGAGDQIAQLEKQLARLRGTTAARRKGHDH